MERCHTFWHLKGPSDLLLGCSLGVTPERAWLRRLGSKISITNHFCMHSWSFWLQTPPKLPLLLVTVGSVNALSRLCLGCAPAVMLLRTQLRSPEANGCVINHFWAGSWSFWLQSTPKLPLLLVTVGSVDALSALFLGWAHVVTPLRTQLRSPEANGRTINHFCAGSWSFWLQSTPKYFSHW